MMQMDGLANLHRLPKPRASDALFRHFAEMIRIGKLRDGDPLPPEREIVQIYGVSRTVVREAVLALSNKGLVEAKPRFRPVVRKPSYDTAMETVSTLVGQLLQDPKGVYNLFETRIMIETALARQAATSGTSQDLEALRAALDANGAVIEDSAAFYASDIAFHNVLYQIPRNPVLPAIQRAYTSWLEPQWSRMPRLSARNRANHQAHTAIFDSIAAKDPDRAEQALRAHLHAAWEQVSVTFPEEEDQQ